MNKLSIAILSGLLVFGMTACVDEPKPVVAQVPPPVVIQQPQQQPQTVVVREEDEGLSAGEAMLVGAAAGAVAGHLTSSSNNNSYAAKPVREVHHYRTKTIVKTKYVSRPSKMVKKSYRTSVKSRKR